MPAEGVVLVSREIVAENRSGQLAVIVGGVREDGCPDLAQIGDRDRAACLFPNVAGNGKYHRREYDDDGYDDE